LQEALKKMWNRVAELQNAIIVARDHGDENEAYELGVEIAELRNLRVRTQARIRELEKK
jgi:hypothetical protein